MKKSLLTMLFITLLLATLSAVPRNLVIVEIGTATWCHYSPGAAIGADDLVADGQPVAIIENHNGDTYTNTYSNERNTYYEIVSFPSATFDGQNMCAGGSNYLSMYANYLPRVTDRMAIPSAYTLGVSGSATGNAFNIEVAVAKIEDDTNANVTLHVVLTESGIQQDWQGQTHLDFVSRMMLPDQTGTPINLSTGQSTNIPLSFNWDPAWNLDQAEIVVFLQCNTTKEILQGFKSSLNFTDSTELIVNSNVPGTIATGGSLAVGQITPWSSGSVSGSTSLVGTYSMVPISGGTWSPAEIVVGAGDFTPSKTPTANLSKTITFTWTAGAPIFDIPAATPTVVEGVTIESTIDLNYDVPSPVQDDVILALPNITSLNSSVTTVLSGSGVGTFTVEVTDAGTWFGLIYYDGSWHQAAPFSLVVPPVPGIFTFSNVNFGAKGDVILLLGEGGDPYTLPVTLSSFTAVPAAQSFVALTWVSESESNMIGYRVYRNESTEFNTATLITPSMIGATNTSTQVTYRHEDREVALNTTYYYWLESVDMTSSELHGPITATVIGNTTPELPTATVMSNVYPNPFRMGNNANIDVALKAGETGNVTVYNILGQSVKTFPVTQGTQKLTWNGRDSKGNACGSGIYFYKLSTPSMNQTKKMVIVK